MENENGHRKKHKKEKNRKDENRRLKTEIGRDAKRKIIKRRKSNENRSIEKEAGRGTTRQKRRRGRREYIALKMGGR